MVARDLGNPLGNPLARSLRAGSMQVRSIQTGVLSAVAGDNNVPIQRIDRKKSIIRFDQIVSGLSSYTLGGMKYLGDDYFTFTGGTQGTTVHWEIIEFDGDVFVDAGLVSMSDVGASVASPFTPRFNNSYLAMVGHGSGTALTGDDISSTSSFIFNYSDMTIKRRFNSYGKVPIIYCQVASFRN